MSKNSVLSPFSHMQKLVAFLLTFEILRIGDVIEAYPVHSSLLPKGGDQRL